MKTSYFFLPVLLSFTFCLHAQIMPDEFGTVKSEQLSMSSYALDEQAEAVILYDFGNTSFFYGDNGFRMIFERKTKIKILKKAGLKYGTIEIPFYYENLEMENVYEIDGYTHSTENGQIKKSKLDPKSVYQEKINDHWMVKKFAMPDVKEGSVIEFTYKVMSPYFFNLHDWEFQHRIPAVYSEYTVKMIPFYEYSYIFQGARKFDVYKNTRGNFMHRLGGFEYPDNIFTFGMKNIPAFRDEEFITSINDYIMKMDFQLAVVHHMNGAKVDVITTWPLLVESLLKENEFGLYMKSAARNAEEILSTLGLESKNELERAEMITDYVKRNFSWDGYNTKFTSKPVKEFLKTRTGNCADINLFLCALFNASGLKANPVILSTRSHGKIPEEFPFQQFLNYVIVNVHLDNVSFLIDATEPLSPFGILPSRCINEKGLIVNKEKPEWVALKDEANSVESDSLYITLNDGLDSAKFSVTMQTMGHKALEYRRAYISDVEKFKKRWLQDEQQVIRPLTVMNDMAIEKPFVIRYCVSVPVEMAGEKILITPFLSLTPSENPLKVGVRNYPVDMVYAETNNFNTVIEIPKGYKFADQNKDVSVDNALVKISYTTENVADKIFVKGTYAFKKAVYLQHEYYSLKSHYSDIVQTFNDKIVLEKL